VGLHESESPTSLGVSCCCCWMKASCTNVRGGFLGAGPVGSGALRASSINGSASRFCGSGLRLGLEVRSTPGFRLRHHLTNGGQGEGDFSTGEGRGEATPASLRK
jgi:hypothetical protein